ncbi:hypothetical protein EDB83DRAFT_2313271 [Lactarius deliciosus]|nr:hypothetical protein EDB83DRAFT_2313271 [Lactarius deliciosus]
MPLEMSPADLLRAITEPTRGNPDLLKRPARAISNHGKNAPQERTPLVFPSYGNPAKTFSRSSLIPENVPTKTSSYICFALSKPQSAQCQYQDNTLYTERVTTRRMCQGGGGGKLLTKTSGQWGKCVRPSAVSKVQIAVKPGPAERPPYCIAIRYGRFTPSGVPEWGKTLTIGFQVDSKKPARDVRCVHFRSLKPGVLVCVDNRTYSFIGLGYACTASEQPTKDWVNQSIPFFYLSFTVKSLDGAAHAVQRYSNLSAIAEWLPGVRWYLTNDDSVIYHTVQLQNTAMFT